jgi:hypothetical protein
MYDMCSSIMQNLRVHNTGRLLKTIKLEFINLRVHSRMSVTVAEWSKARTVLARLVAGIEGSNPTRGMDIYVYVYFMLALSFVGRGLAMS